MSYDLLRVAIQPSVSPSPGREVPWHTFYEVTMADPLSNAVNGTPLAAELPVLFLNRLTRLIEIKASRRGEDATSERRLLDHALYSTYQDCLDVGLATVARAAIAKARQGQS
jgi:hypothetical protein